MLAAGVRRALRLVLFLLAALSLPGPSLSVRTMSSGNNGSRAKLLSSQMQDVYGRHRLNDNTTIRAVFASLIKEPIRHSQHSDNGWMIKVTLPLSAEERDSDKVLAAAKLHIPISTSTKLSQTGCEMVLHMGRKRHGHHTHVPMESSHAYGSSGQLYRTYNVDIWPQKLTAHYQRLMAKSPHLYVKITCQRTGSVPGTLSPINTSKCFERCQPLSLYLQRSFLALHIQQKSKLAWNDFLHHLKPGMRNQSFLGLLQELNSRADGEKELASLEATRRKRSSDGQYLNSPCTRRSLSLNFKDLVLHFVITSPISLEIGFCAGSCNDLQAEEHDEREYLHRIHADSDHDLLHQMVSYSQGRRGSGYDILRQCCRPLEYASENMVLTYITGENDVVSDIFVVPDVIVKSCICQ